VVSDDLYRQLYKLGDERTELKSLLNLCNPVFLTPQSAMDYSLDRLHAVLDVKLKIAVNGDNLRRTSLLLNTKRTSPPNTPPDASGASTPVGSPKLPTLKPFGSSSTG
jgi:hypothetical protein